MKGFNNKAEELEKRCKMGDHLTTNYFGYQYIPHEKETLRIRRTLRRPEYCYRATRPQSLPG